MILCCLVVLGLLAGTQAQESCSKQLELEHRCMFSIESSPEADSLRARKKEIIKTCAPNLADECHAMHDAMHDCAISIAKNKDNDPLFTESKPKSQAAVDQCFAKYPPDVHKAFEELFMKPPHHEMHKRHWEHRNETESEGTVDNSSSEEGNYTAEFDRRHHGGGGGRGGGGRGGRGGHGRHGGRGHGGRGGRGGRGGHGRHCHHGGRGHHGGHHGPRNLTSSESNSNETSGETGGQSGENGGQTGEKSESKEKGDKPKCRKTKEQWKCIKNEFKKLGNDTSIVNTINGLIRQKKKCKQIVDWSCTPKCPKKQKCLFQATKPCRQVFMTRMKECLQGKGFTLPPFMSHGEEGTGPFTTPLSVLQPL